MASAASEKGPYCRSPVALDIFFPPPPFYRPGPPNMILPKCIIQEPDLLEAPRLYTHRRPVSSLESRHLGSYTAPRHCIPMPSWRALASNRRLNTSHPSAIWSKSTPSPI